MTRTTPAVLVLLTAAAMVLSLSPSQADGAAAVFRHGRTWGRTIDVNAFSFGQCTWGALHKFAEATGVYPWVDGDARHWPGSAAANGWTTVEQAESRAIVLFQPGVHGAHATGHAAWVDAVSDTAEGVAVHLTEMNGNGLADGTWSSRTVVHSPGMSYILAP